MAKKTEPEFKKPMDIVENPKVKFKNNALSKLAGSVTWVLNKLVPDFAPKLIIEEKLIENEIEKDYALIRYYSEIQILIGAILMGAGAIGFLSSNGLYLLVCILGGVLVLTGFDIEEIYVTNIRLLIRRIGLFERIIRLPSDEEHLLKHIVSLSIGRAPMHKILMTLAAIGFFVEITISIGNITGIMILITSFSLFILGLRLGKRVVTLNLAGGHYIILGLRKGVPTHLIKSIMSSTLNE